MSKAFFIDTTLCTACRACQVACKQWHDLPAEKTKNLGTYQNPADLSFDTYKLVRMNEEVIGGRLQWLFFPEQCRHCVEAPCLETAGDEGAIYQDPSGAIIYTAQTSTDMETWVTDGVTLSDIDPDGRMTTTVDRSSPRRFMRLMVED